MIFVYAKHNEEEQTAENLNILGVAVCIWQHKIVCCKWLYRRKQSFEAKIKEINILKQQGSP